MHKYPKNMYIYTGGYLYKKKKGYSPFLLACLVGDFHPQASKAVAEPLNGIPRHIAIIPREPVGFQLPPSPTVAGDVSALIPREEKLPTIVAGHQLSGIAAVSESIEQGLNSGEISVHCIFSFRVGLFLTPLTLMIIKDNRSKVKIFQFVKITKKLPFKLCIFYLIIIHSFNIHYS